MGRSMSKYVEMLAHAQWNMDGRDFNKYCLNRWRRTSMPGCEFDSYHAEKFPKFQKDIIGYLTSLSGEAYRETLLGILEWYVQHQDSINSRGRNVTNADGKAKEV